jgi:hypothetical protein
MRRILVCSIYALALTLATAAIARDDDDQQRNRNAQLRGQYALTSTIECIVSGIPFNADFTPAALAASTKGTLVGVQTFNGDGTATFKVRSIGMNPPPATPLGRIGVGSSDGTAQLNYSIDNQGLLSMDLVPGTFVHVTNLAGPGAGSSFTVNHHALSGMVSRDKKTIVLGTVDPLMETQTITPVSGVPVTHYRVCTRTAVLTQIDD